MIHRFAVFFSIITIGACWFPGPALSDDTNVAPKVEIFKTPGCGCCSGWADHLAANGFRIEVTEVKDLGEVKRSMGALEDSQTCHTGSVDGYVIDGHVPAADIKRLLAERPETLGLVVPGMPRGSPGMESPIHDSYTVYTFDESGRKSVFSRH